MIFRGQRIILILLSVFLTAGFSSCKQKDDLPVVTEYFLINNTRHTFDLYSHAENLESDTIYRIAAGSRFCIMKVTGARNYSALQLYIDQWFIRLIDENKVDWLPRISDPAKWGEIKFPVKEVNRQVFFIMMNPLNDGMNRLQSLGIIRLLRISQAMTYLILLSSVIGLFYVRLRFKFLYILVAVFLNYPVIYYTADFGYTISHSIDFLFIIPTWVVESSKYYVRFPVPVGAIIVWFLLIGSKFFKNRRT
jgi:hypothetical protein